MEEAREARARVLAAKAEGGEKGEPDAAGAAPTTPPPPGEATAAGPPAAPRAAVGWRIAAGFLAGAAASAAVVWALLPGEQAEPLPFDADITAPIEESGAPEPRTAAEAPSAGSPTVETATNDGADGDGGGLAGIAEVPEVSAADRARAAARRAAESEVRERASTSPATQMPAGSDVGGPSEAVSPEDVPARPEEEPATGSAGEPPAQPSAAATDGRPEETAAGGEADTDAVPGDEGVNGRETATASPAEAADAAPEPAPVESADVDVDSQFPPPAPAEDTPEVAEASAPDAAAPADDAAPAGVGVLYVRAAPRVSPEELDDVVASLSAAGYAIADTRRVDFRISQTNVRYFHEADAELAAGVAGTISGIARDFTDFEPTPDPGTIEVWLEG